MVLDEASSALDGATEHALYTALAQAVPSYVSVGHRPSLFRHHTYVCAARDAGDGGGWSVLPTAEYLRYLERHRPADTGGEAEFSAEFGGEAARAHRERL